MRQFIKVTAIAVAMAVASTVVQGQTFDGTTRESFERSAKSMTDGMSEADREIFARGLMNMIVTEYPAASGLEGLALLSVIPAATEAAHITLDGISKDDVMARGRSVIAAQAPKAASPSTGSVLECLVEKVEIAEAAVTKGTYGYEISVNVTNGLSFALSGVRFRYRVISEGRSVPWKEEDISISISGGIEPAETKTIGTSVFGIPSDAIEPLITTVSLLDVADATQHLLIGDVRVIGWSEGQSTEMCE